MDKNVGSVNLDELKAAREALDKERGIETDPDMYNDYDPEKHKAEKEQEKLARLNADENEAGGVFDAQIQEPVDLNKTSSEENSEPSSSSMEDNFKVEADSSASVSNSDESAIQNNAEVSAEENLNIYDSFADFEVNSEASAVATPVYAESQNTQEAVAEPVLADGAKVEKVFAETPAKSEVDSSLDDFLSELDNILSREEDDEEIEIATNNNVVEENNINAKSSSDVEIENVKEPIEDNDSNGLEDDVFNESELLAMLEGELGESAEESIKPEIEEEVKPPVEEISTTLTENQNIEDSKTEELVDDAEENESTAEPVKIEDDDELSGLKKFEIESDNPADFESNDVSDFNTEILTDFSKLGEIASEIEAENNAPVLTEEVEEEVVEEPAEEEVEEKEEDIEVGGYQKIEPIKFIDIISTEDFKDADKFSYVLGKDDEGEVVFGNLRDTCGTLIYTKNEDVVFCQFGSILLSLLLKNTPEDIQFVICDAMFDSEFDVFNDSSYMYFNRVAKNNREIVDTLLELSKELENRYNNLVYAGVKTISAFNLNAEERGNPKMPYIVLFMNNYTKMTQFLDTDRINTCLHNIIKFGRLVGMYVILAATAEIERKDINLNLPTRIAYQTDTAEESVSIVGREGAERLKDEEDFLYSTVYDEELRHLKVAELTDEEIKVIIENLEN